MTPAELHAKTVAAITSAMAARTTPTPVPSTGFGVDTFPTIFNWRALPDDVKDRYKKKVGHEVLCPGDLDPFPPAGRRYNLDGTVRLILADGTVFPMIPLDENGPFRDPITCKDDSPDGKRMCYQQFVAHIMDYGCYAHPLWLFRETTGEWGATYRNDDLPQHLTSLSGDDGGQS